MTAAIMESLQEELARVGIPGQAKRPAIAKPTAIAHRSKQRHELRRAASEATLATILPAQFESGATWHVLSHGDIDALSYLRHAIAGYGYFDLVAISTWCIAMPDLLELRKWLDTGKIDRLELYGGEIFPSQYPDEYALATRMAAEYGMRLVVARNHSKVILARNDKEAAFLVMEGSANVNTNPRIEQTAISNDADLLNWYLTFFNGLRSIDKRQAPDASRAGP